MAIAKVKQVSGGAIAFSVVFKKKLGIFGFVT